MSLLFPGNNTLCWPLSLERLYFWLLSNAYGTQWGVSFTLNAKTNWHSSTVCDGDGGGKVRREHRKNAESFYFKSFVV